MKLFFHLCIQFVLMLAGGNGEKESKAKTNLNGESKIKGNLKFDSEIKEVGKDGNGEWNGGFHTWNDSHLSNLQLNYSKLNHTLVLVHASWCMACKQYLPSFHRQSRQILSLRPNVNIIEIHYDDSSMELCARLQVRYLPSTFFIHKGEMWQIGMEKRQRLAVFIIEEEWKMLPSEGKMGNNPFNGNGNNLIGWMIRTGRGFNNWFNKYINIYAWLIGGFLLMLITLLWSLGSMKNHAKLD